MGGLSVGKSQDPRLSAWLEQGELDQGVLILSVQLHELAITNAQVARACLLTKFDRQHFRLVSAGVQNSVRCFPGTRSLTFTAADPRGTLCAARPLTVAGGCMHS
jgi:hypothetical protein